MSADITANRSSALNETFIEPISAQAVGVGLKPVHYHDIAAAKTKVTERPDFFEVHAENFMGAGGPPHRWLTAIREDYSLSVHGVCLSIGGENPLDENHMARLKAVVDRYQPSLVSEHLAWCAHGGIFFNDLLAPPMSAQSLERTARHVDELQDRLGRRVLIENPSLYLKSTDALSEPEFLNTLAARTGCGLLLDINNVFVSAKNLDFDPIAYLGAIDASVVEEIHLAGHAVDEMDGVEMRVDNHGAPICEEVGALYQHFVSQEGARPTLVEWDTDIPPYDALLIEAARARNWMRATADPKAAYA